MDWQAWIIPVIAVGVYIVSQLMSREANKRPAARPTPPPPRPPEEPAAKPGQRPARVSTEMDRFLEEVRRRQKPPPKPREADQPQPSPRPAATIPVRIPEPVRTRVSKPAEVIPRAIPVLKAVPLPAAPELSAPPQPAVVAMPPPRPATKAVLQVRELLKNPQGLAAALVLREILDKPVSCRPRRPGVNQS